LIVCDISGYGSSGPYRDKRAYDLLVQCETGLVSTTGTEDTPSKAGISAADIAAGMYAYSGILTALYRRERTGRGAAMEVSLFDALGEWMGYPAYFTAYGGTPPARTGASHATIAPYGPFATGDGKRVHLGIQNEREWTRFCESVLQRPALATDPRFSNVANRVAHRAALTAAIHEVFKTLTRAEIVARLDRAHIANASQNTMQEFWDHPQLAARDRWREVASPAGPIKALLPPVIMDATETRMDPIPDVGEHTETILKALGYDTAQINELRADSVI
jgi:crotonobetainyl-CoA:carnitine CoA-transferase CaiB-like acyl-CoA transferase